MSIHYIVLLLIVVAVAYLLLGLKRGAGGKTRPGDSAGVGQRTVARELIVKTKRQEDEVIEKKAGFRDGGSWRPMQRSGIEVETLWRLEHVLRELRNPSGAVVQVDFSLEPREIALALASNPMYAARILKTVNSAVFGLRTRIDSLPRAITFLGYNQVKNIIFQNMAHDNLGILDDSPAGFDQKRFWQHSHAVSACAEHILREMGADHGRAGTITTAALLHDIGWAVFGRFDSKAAQTLFARLAEDGSAESALQEEEAAFGFNHLLAGEMLAEQWQIPPAVCGLIGRHHCGTFGLPPETDRDLAFGACVISRAESLTAEIGYGHPAAEPLEQKQEILAAAGLKEISTGGVRRLKEELMRTMKLIDEFSQS